jgi:branched-chain amino acid transport system substrate-binding protein
MRIDRRTLLGAATLAAAASVLPAPRARAQGKPALKVGVLTDLSGPYKDLAGPQAVQAVYQAMEDYGVSSKAFTVEVVSADHQNKPDVGKAVAAEWYDRQGVDLIVEATNSAVGLAVAGVAKDKNKVYINSGAASSDLTGTACNGNTIHWAYDTFMLAKSTGGALAKAGGDRWFFVTADYAFGKTLQRDTTGFIEAAGGKVVGSVAYPFPGTTDFSSMLLQAQNSGAKVLGLANAGADTINSIKQAKEFGLNLTIAGLLLFISDVHALGLDVAQGIALTDSFYWDHDDRTRAFSNRMKTKFPSARPTMVHAGVYSSTLHWLKVAGQAGAEAMKGSGTEVVEKLKALPTDDDCFGKGVIRIDGRKLHPSYLWKIKKPSDSKGPWDYYAPISSLPADQAFRDLNAGGCPLVKA